MNKPKVVEKRSIYKCPFFEIREDDLVFENGTKWTYAHEVVGRGGVSIVALDDKQNIYLVKEYRHPVGEVLLSLPCGGIDKGDEPVESAKKELQEEAGLEAGKWTFIGNFYSSPGHSNDKGWAYLAEDLEAVESHIESYEQIEVLKIPFIEAIEKIDSGEILDAWAIVPILLVSRFLEKNR